ncbi:RNA-directed DNA polymerase, eukaryota, reverse transcriptase zinc-binding domain protein [Tanacetum coccineum]
MVEDPLLMKKKDQIKFDEEVARELEAKLKAEMDEEDRAARLKEEEASIALIESWENTQAMMDADYELAASLQEEDRAELTIKEKSKLFVKLMNKRNKHFEKLRVEERRRKPPTKAQKRNQMCTYLKNMAGFIHNQLKSKTFEEVQQAFNNTIGGGRVGMVGREDRTFTIDDPLTSTATGVTRKMVWIQWENILASKNNGGLGVASFYSTNRALLFKWIWRFFNDGSSLWSRFIKAINGVRGAMDTQSVPTRGSIWLDLVREFSFLKFKGIDLLALMKRKLGNGENTLFWDDIWSSEAPLKSKFPRLYALEESKGISVGSKMGLPSLLHSFRRHPRGGVEIAQFKDLCDITDDVLLPQMQDRWDAPTRWVKLVPIKINILAWKIYLDRLPTRLNLSGRGLDIPSILCPLCNEAVESTSHIFFSCSLARQVMRKVCRW